MRDLSNLRDQTRVRGEDWSKVLVENTKPFELTREEQEYFDIEAEKCRRDNNRGFVLYQSP